MLLWFRSHSKSWLSSRKAAINKSRNQASGSVQAAILAWMHPDFHSTDDPVCERQSAVNRVAPQIGMSSAAGSSVKAAGDSFGPPRRRELPLRVWTDEQRCIQHYQALAEALDGAAFIDDLQTRMLATSPAQSSPHLPSEQSWALGARAPGNPPRSWLEMVKE
jgi:hypothetical protein